MEIITNVIWIDPNIKNEENSEYKKKLEKIGNIKLKCFETVKEAINHLKKIKFQETKIIISGKVYIEFVELFQENILDMCVVPKIIIFTSNKEKFIEKNLGFKSIIDDLFYNYGGIKILFEDIKAFIMNENKEVNSYKSLKSKRKGDEIPFTFEYIDSLEKLALPLFYKTLIDTISKDNIEKYTDLLYIQYSKLNTELKELLYSIKSIKNIPIELLSKFYARLYTAESDFYKNMNKDLGLNKIDNYLPYIKTLYEGVKLKALPLASNNILFRGSKIENVELRKLKNYLKKKDPNLPGAIGFSKSFLSFSKDRGRAEYFLGDENKFKNKKSKVLYILEKDDNLGFNLSTHGDIEEISFLDYEKEVLFFPFSSFEIKEINEITFKNEKIQEIRLLYLGKYLKKLENDKELIIKSTNLPESEFKNQLIKFGLIKPEKMKNINIKGLYNCYKKYEEEIKKNNKIKDLKPKSNESNINIMKLI